MIAGFQGESGAFSEEAALALLGPVQTRGYRTFDELVRAVDTKEVALGILPCENTIAGPIARAYDLLSEFTNVGIVDETTHRVEQCLIGMREASIERLERVASHPVALEQCRSFLQRHPRVRIDVAEDTAGSVRRVLENGNPRSAAIGPALAAKRYGGLVLEAGIQDDANNFTRFFLISAHKEPRRTLGRACLALSLAHEPGSLHDALGIIAKRGLNLRSLVARPNRRRAFEYVFYLEIDAPAELDVELVAKELGSGTRILAHY